MSLLCLVPLQAPPGSPAIRELGERLGRRLRVRVEVRPPWFDPAIGWDATRRQHHSTRILAALLQGAPTSAPLLLAVADVDLFIPILTWVFGEAQLDGRAAVVSTHRLRQEVYGLPPDPGLLMERLEKESVHEVGHLLGLRHCPHPTCAMRSSTWAGDVDLKSAELCPDCRAAARRLDR